MADNPQSSKPTEAGLWEAVAQRRDYELAELTEALTAPEPLEQFERWMGEALERGVREPNAMVLATADAQGRPSCRMVLLRGLDSRGFVFFTNYDSRKARDLTANPQAALTFFWAELERQVRIEGEVARVDAAESDAYFKGRPRDSRLGAWASPQSEVIESRQWLEARVEDFKARHADAEVERPENWGGYRLQPRVVEFWQGRPSRLHDRLRFSRRSGEGGWLRERLAP